MPITITITLKDATLDADLTVPEDPRGMVLFAHGSGSSRRSPRNRAVAAALNDAGHATLLPDLLTAAEERRDAATAEHRFDIPLLAARLTGMIDRMADDPRIAALPLGVFGASTGAAAALVAAAERPGRVSAVVSRGGRPDLAGAALARVRAPTLLLVGAHDPHVLALNERAAHDLRAHDLRVIPGAGHLFAEPGALAKVTAFAIAWFGEHLRRHPGP